MVQIDAPTFLGCWALISLTFVTCFHKDDHFILLYAITHVETIISLFQVALPDVRAMLPQVVRFQVPLFENLMVQSYP